MGLFDLFKKKHNKINFQGKNDAEEKGGALDESWKKQPRFYPELAGYQMDMHTSDCKKYRFILTGLKIKNSNISGCNGYGSDEWFFQCKYSHEECILCFSDDASYGTMWECAIISKEDAEKLYVLPASEWHILMFKSERRIFHLHPDMIDSAKEIVQDTFSRLGSINDNGFYGR